MREHGPALAHTEPPAHSRRHVTARGTLLASGGTLAVGAAVAGGTPAHVAGKATPAAYTVRNNPDGTVTLAVYQKSGIAGANAKLRTLGDKNVVLVPVEPGCPRPGTPAVSGHSHLITMGISISPNGDITVKARGIPAGDIVVIGVQTTGRTSMSGAELTSPPAPSCISLPAPPPGSGGSGS